MICFRGLRLPAISGRFGQSQLRGLWGLGRGLTEQWLGIEGVGHLATGFYVWYEPTSSLLSTSRQLSRMHEDQANRGLRALHAGRVVSRASGPKLPRAATNDAYWVPY